MKTTLVCPRCKIMQPCITTPETNQCIYCFHVWKKEVQKSTFGDVENLMNIFGMK